MNTNPQADPEPIDDLHAGIDSGDFTVIKQALVRLHPSEIADLLESVPPGDRKVLWDLIGPELEGDVLSHVADSVRPSLLETMLPDEVAAATQELDTDDAVDILQDLPEDMVDQVLRSMGEQNRRRVGAVLSYPEDTAGGLMNNDAFTVRSDVTLEVVLRFLRRQDKLPPDTNALMVVDRDNHFLGQLALGTILTEDLEAQVSQLMEAEIAGIPATTGARDVARLFEQRDLLSAPVVDEDGKLVGRITVDDVIDVIRQQGDHSLMGLAGLDEDNDMFAPVFKSARERAVWLGINLITAFLAAWVIGCFEATIREFVALAILMPIVASMGGVAGNQTLTIAIRGLALGQLGTANARSLLLKELGVGVLNGLLWALVVGLAANWWFDNPTLALVIAAAMMINLVTAAFAGAVIPVALQRMEVDPAVAGAVVLTTVTDVIGFLAFLGIAALFLV